MVGNHSGRATPTSERETMKRLASVSVSLVLLRITSANQRRIARTICLGFGVWTMLWGLLVPPDLTCPAMAQGVRGTDSEVRLQGPRGRTLERSGSTLAGPGVLARQFESNRPAGTRQRALEIQRGPGGLDRSLTIQRPLGGVTRSLEIDRGPGGVQRSLNVEREFHGPLVQSGVALSRSAVGVVPPRMVPPVVISPRSPGATNAELGLALGLGLMGGLLADSLFSPPPPPPPPLVAVPVVPGPPVVAVPEAVPLSPKERAQARLEWALDRVFTGGPTERRDAALALGRSGDPRVVPALIDVMKNDKKSEVRQAAARALGQTGDPRALRPLELTAQYDPSQEVRQVAATVRAHFALREPEVQPASVPPPRVPRTNSNASVDQPNTTAAPALRPPAVSPGPVDVPPPPDFENDADSLRPNGSSAPELVGPRSS